MDTGIVSSDILCPLDSRRPVRGLILKLFIVNFITLGYYFHFYRKREGRYLTLDAFVFFLTPLDIIGRYLAALVAIAGVAGFRLLQGCFIHESQTLRQKAYSDATRALEHLLGKAPQAIGYVPVREASPTGPSRLERAAHRVGPLLTAGAFLTQCSGAIFLYTRRDRPDGVTVIDNQIFELACGGLLLGVLSTCYTLELPIFRNCAPQVKENRLDRLVWFLRDNGDDEFLGFYILKATAIAFCVRLVLCDVALLKSYQILWDPGQWLLVTCTLIVCCVLAGFAATGSMKKFSFLEWLFRAVFLALMFFLCFMLGSLGIYGTLEVLYSHVSRYFRALVEASALGNAPQDKPCPMLWADPWSEYIWWLA